MLWLAKAATGGPTVPLVCMERVQCRRCYRTWWLFPACRDDRLCARSPGSNPNLGTRTAYAHISTREHHDRDQLWLFGTMTDPYQADVNGSAYQQGTVGPPCKGWVSKGLGPCLPVSTRNGICLCGNILEVPPRTGQPALSTNVHSGSVPWTPERHGPKGGRSCDAL